MADKILNCVECGLAFVFSEDERRRHSERGYGHEPRRCPPCRIDARNRRRQQEESSRRRQAPGPGHITLCTSCGVEVFLTQPSDPYQPVLCDNCRPARAE
jgi:hypothetical protein